jgi:2'-5' RNA ligase
MQKAVRTFIAVDISPEIRSKTQRLIGELAPTSANVKWVETHNLHLTLKFLGDVELLEMPDVCLAVEEAVASLPPFEFHAHGAGAFPTLERPRTIWLGIDAGADEMRALHAALEVRLAPFGFRREQRRFRPHLTIGRVRDTSDAGVRDLARRLAACRDFVGGSSDVSEVVVYSSELGREGPTYEPLAHCPLGGS